MIMKNVISYYSRKLPCWIDFVYLDQKLFQDVWYNVFKFLVDDCIYLRHLVNLLKTIILIVLCPLSIKSYMFLIWSESQIPFTVILRRVANFKFLMIRTIYSTVGSLIFQGLIYLVSGYLLTREVYYPVVYDHFNRLEMSQPTHLCLSYGAPFTDAIQNSFLSFLTQNLSFSVYIYNVRRTFSSNLHDTLEHKIVLFNPLEQTLLQTRVVSPSDLRCHRS